MSPNDQLRTRKRIPKKVSSPPPENYRSALHAYGVIHSSTGTNYVKAAIEGNMAIQDRLGDDFYVFRDGAGHARQALLEAHGAFGSKDQKNWVPGIQLVWFSPHGMTNSAGFAIDDVLTGRSNYYKKKRADQVSYNYTIPKFATAARSVL